MSVRYRGDLADLVVSRVDKRQGCDAHERTVAVVALTGASFAGVQGAGGRAAVIENAVDRILATGNPAYELVAHVCGVDVPKLPYRVAGSKRHGSVIAPGAGGLLVRAVAGHVGAFERAARHKLVWNAKRVADGKPIDAVAQCCFRSVCHEKHLLYFGLRMRGYLRQCVQPNSGRSESRIGRACQLI